MADRLVDFATKSLVHHIETNVSVDNAYIVTPDFNWDRKPSALDPGNNTVARALPYAAIELVTDEVIPFTVSENILYEANISLEISVCAGSYTACLQSTADIKQSLRSARSITSGVGITLYNFASASGAFFETAGTLELELRGTDFPMPEAQRQEGNIKFRSVTPIILTAFRDATSTLLENKGRINLTDS